MTSDCTPKPNGQNCPTPAERCSPFDLSTSKDACYIEQVANEHLDIGGAIMNVFPLLGVHEQGQLVDLAGSGNAISGGDAPNYPKEQAFTTFNEEWRSSQTGESVLTDAYIGYDFGQIKLDNNRVRYGIDASVRHNIATIRVKQSDCADKRITRMRVERSNDNIKWYGVTIVTLPDTDELATVNFNHSVPSRYWRFRPVDFTGGPTDRWHVSAIQLIDYDSTSIDDIQDEIFQENRDRDYGTESIALKGSYDLLDVQTEISRFGIELTSQQFYITMSFSEMVQKLGRPVVIGDIFQMPSETQYNTKLEPVLKYVEVTDVGWSPDGFTPGWTPTMMRVVARPMIASQETADIFGGIEPLVDSSGLLDVNDGNHPVFQDYSEASQTIEAEECIQVPERGTDTNKSHQFSQQHIETAAEQDIDLAKLNYNERSLYVEDGMPPNGETYSEGNDFPSSPQDGNYHRLTYTHIDRNIPARLFRWSLVKNRWIFCESDKRALYNSTKPTLQEFLTSPTRIPANEIE